MNSTEAIPIGTKGHITAPLFCGCGFMRSGSVVTLILDDQRGYHLMDDFGYVGIDQHRNLFVPDDM